MKQYTIIGTYKIAEGQQIDTCQHCGRSIKNVVILRDNLTNETLKVGTTCINKIMKLNESVNKALVSTINGFNKSICENKKYISYSLENIKNDYLEALNKKELGVNNWENTTLQKADLYYSICTEIFYNLKDMITKYEKLTKIAYKVFEEIEININDVNDKIDSISNYLFEIENNKYYPEV